MVNRLYSKRKILYISAHCLIVVLLDTFLRERIGIIMSVALRKGALGL